MSAYYNEIDPFAAEWLRVLISKNLIAPGDVDDRDMRDVKPDELRGYTQCHFFAGIGVWSYAARLAGWPDEEPLWTGSCPCQPHSQAGRGQGFADERHLWPHWHHLIRECRPTVVLGEQVSGKGGLAWLDLVQSDLEGSDYACGALDTSSAGNGAPHIRQRIRFAAVRLGHSQRARLEGHGGHGDGGRKPGRHEADAAGPTTEAGRLGWMADDSRAGRLEQCAKPSRGNIRGVTKELGERSWCSSICAGDGQPGPTNGFWADADWLRCRDGKWRPVRPGSFPLAHGAAARVGRLRCYGNAVDAQATKIFIEAVRESVR